MKKKTETELKTGKRKLTETIVSNTSYNSNEIFVLLAYNKIIQQMKTLQLYRLFIIESPFISFIQGLKMRHICRKFGAMAIVSVLRSSRSQLIKI